MGPTGGSSGGLAGIFLHLGSVSTPAKSKTQTSGQHCYQNGSLFVYSETQKSWREPTIIRIYPIIRSLFLDQSRHWTGNVEDALSTSKSTVHFYVRTPLRPPKKPSTVTQAGVGVPWPMQKSQDKTLVTRTKSFSTPPCPYHLRLHLYRRHSPAS